MRGFVDTLKAWSRNVIMLFYGIPLSSCKHILWLQAPPDKEVCITGMYSYVTKPVHTLEDL
ncbi:hypothetical protein STFR1_60223 [Bacillus vallismortis]